jgi:hypothetical protein
MPTEMSEKEIYEEAKKRVKAKKGFYGHLGAYLAVNVVLIIIWVLSGDASREWIGAGDWTGNKWFLWPLTIWGVFVIVHFLQVFVFQTSIRGEKAAIDKEIEKIEKE